MLSDIRSSDESGDDLASSTETERFTAYNLPRSLSEADNQTRSDELQGNGPLTRQNTTPTNLERVSSGIYLTIIPRARMGSESIAHEIELRPNGLLTQSP